MDKESRIYVAGHTGMVGSALVRRLHEAEYWNLLLRPHAELDLTRQDAVEDFFAAEKPDIVLLAAAKVGGIAANSEYPADFIYDNLVIQTNVIHAAWRHGVKKLLFLGSSCIYPRLAEQPISEDALLGGPLEPTNEWYAVAKITGIKMCQAYRQQYGFNAIAVMPTNLYGPNDNFDLETAHVLPALIRKFHEAHRDNLPAVTIWGSGKPRREFLHVDDLADACLFLLQSYDDGDIINIGTGKDIPIIELAECIRDIVGYRGDLELDTTRPDGTPRKLLDVTRLASMGWQARIPLQEGIASTYQWYREHVESSN
ncbi:MAG TPA: GDP-L-fucose synthase [Gammaproteobacteria bacterium]|nr:GDP-L-fucose synthase [Gammaproteobacteria bacterium]